ncbi:FMN-binding negative transcriptional regulator [Hyphomicrobium sp.]|jgi:transcriptional regulator|uniref:FMN-binding negative transcriptional regulator n=1 Tax=Hyphomicrobium sp. TaxID=82 RepID=UPI0035646135
MYIPPVFRVDDVAEMHRVMREARLATLVTATEEGMIGTPLPMLLDESEGRYGTLYAHVARANPQWKIAALGEGLAIFSGPDAYITPSWYATKRQTGKVVPTWDYVAVHAYGSVEFFDNTDRLLDVVTRLTDLHERPLAMPWAVSDAPTEFVQSQLRGIVGVRMSITRLDGKRKMSQNRSAEDRQGVINGLANSGDALDAVVADLVPTLNNDR